MTENEIINEFEKELKYVKENEKYDDFNPIIDIDLCENVLNIMKLQNKKIKEFDAKLTIQQGLIDYQKTEIERLKLECYKLYPKGSAYSMQVEASDRLEHQIKSEAITEFAERLKEKCYEDFQETCEMLSPYVTDDDIDELVKEMMEVETNQRKEDEGK